MEVSFVGIWLGAAALLLATTALWPGVKPLRDYVWGMSPIGVGAFGPFLAALVVLNVTEGKPGIQTLLRRIVHWRVGWQCYLVAFGLPILMAGLASYLTVLMGAPVPTATQLAAWPGIGLVFLMRMLVPGLGGTWEEPGWCGYAVHQLDKGRSRLWAMSPIWIIIVIWHIPLFVTGDAEWVDIFNMVAGVIILHEVWNNLIEGVFDASTSGVQAKFWVGESGVLVMR